MSAGDEGWKPSDVLMFEIKVLENMQACMLLYPREFFDLKKKKKEAVNLFLCNCLCDKAG